MPRMGFELVISIFEKEKVLLDRYDVSTRNVVT
jgi:hypothetical protein